MGEKRNERLDCITVFTEVTSQLSEASSTLCRINLKTQLLFSFASLSRIENISIISNNAKTTVIGGSRQQLSSLLQNSE